MKVDEVMALAATVLDKECPDGTLVQVRVHYPDRKFSKGHYFEVRGKVLAEMPLTHFNAKSQLRRPEQALRRSISTRKRRRG